MEECIILPEKENFLRLRDCDFNFFLPNEVNRPNFSKRFFESEKSKIPGTLKKINNPILVLFYYNDTEEKDRRILTEFYEASYETSNYEKGSIEDSLIGKSEDMDFKFGFVNLDLDKKVLKTFQTMNGLNPFYWARIEQDKDTDEFFKSPFIIFYYHSLPQFMYEGTVDSNTIKREFKNWRKELVELENKELKGARKKEITREGYFTALEDDQPQVGMKKGKTYYITLEEIAGKYNYTVKEV